MNSLQSSSPDFFVVGTMKTGSTSLYRYLQQHPQIFARRKEPHYFCYCEVGPIPPQYVKPYVNTNKNLEGQTQDSITLTIGASRSNWPQGFDLGQALQVNH